MARQKGIIPIEGTIDNITTQVVVIAFTSGVSLLFQELARNIEYLTTENRLSHFV